MRKTSLTILCAAALAVGVTGCTAERTDDTLDEDRAAAVEPATAPVDTATPADTTPGPAAARLTVATSADGQYLTDRQNRAVYMLEGDGDGSKCTAACVEAWPPLRADSGEAPGSTAPDPTGPTASTGAAGNLRADRVGTIQRADGISQVTYNGHPLYHYSKDTGPGTSTGHDVSDQWGEWYLVTPEGDAMDDDDA